MNDLYGTRKLSVRECEVVKLVAEGLNNLETAAQMGVKLGTVKNSLRRIYDKIGMSNRTELALWYVSRNPQGEQKQ